ncbi:unnamed protein product [Euphydryas editha]|uniref:C2H2-type domain-containing protein n=1 Tax=Euphydryas editha TaxID=104508 RepID=A0AAU9U2M1_EUPED|nr:unnamed protein product [Euphydryas editha]
MNLEYDRKFEEMKKYIPFLESMIKRLENTNSSSNPRQAQLDKIRSLRDLLMDKKKRMKMENLLKCEQVLINLYEKVEQRDSNLISRKDGNNSEKDKADLNMVRNKLKSAVSKLHKESVETLPEIARASETEEVCVPGSKEPALFQRRPNKSSTSPTRPLPNKIKETSPQMSKRNYTRILLSPEPNQKHWSVEENKTEKPLFSRRSPRKSPRRRSPSYHRKERRKPSKSKTKDVEPKGLNITLNVPQESLDSLNTKDILSRIINCSDNDVDIDTLRELRSQILGELKETGANEDITDLILKSYKKTGKQNKKSEEIEEGELSDSESEVIESIYGSLVIKDKEKICINTTNKIPNEENPRKIQICLVINSDKNKSTSTKEEQDKILPIDKSDFETFDSENSEKSEKYSMCNNFDESAALEKNVPNTDPNQNIPVEAYDLKAVENADEGNKEFGTCQESEKKEKTENEVQKATDIESKEIKKPDFYKPIVEESDNKKYLTDEEQTSKTQLNLPNDQNKDTSENSNMSIENSKVEIPLLEPTKNVSEIDILQALKKEILSETNNVLSSDAVTPPLHQPKITKVVNALEVGSKKRISIENYKAKSNTPLKNVIGNETCSINKDDVSRKNSLKLTEKECERFNFPSKLTLNESSDEEDKSILSVEDIYENLAPKSPDHDDFADTGIKPPVIIPSDPIQTMVSSEVDIDMRKILPILQSNSNTDINAFSLVNENSLKSLNTEKDITKNKEITAMPLLDPRKKKDVNTMVPTESQNQCMINVDKTPRSAVNYVNSAASMNLLQNVTSNTPLTLNVNVTNRSLMSPNIPGATTNITPNMVPNLHPTMTPIILPNVCNIPNMTPNARSYEMTPSRQIIDNDDFIIQKHVYAPIFPIVDKRDLSEKQWDGSEGNRLPIWEDPRSIPTQRDISVKRDTDVRSSSTQKDIEYNPMYEQYQKSPRNDRFAFDKIDPSHRMDCPTTPIHSFGRLDCPATPTPSFGRMDVPMTPVHPFGRSECPATPSHAFGMSECPATPNHPFGRQECPATPNHPFGRPEPLLPTPFLRPDFNQHVSSQSFGKPFDPRLNRNPDYENYHNRDDDRDRSYFQEHTFNVNYKSDNNNRNNNPELFRRFQREKSMGRNERNKNYDNSGRNYREQRRETSTGRYNRDYDNDRSYTRNRGSSNRSHDYRHQNEFRNYDETNKRSYRSEKSVSRTSHSSTKDSNVDKTFSKDKRLSVQRHTGHSFIIDTSINSTFQDNSHKNSFDFRRQRAASVGRTLNRCPSPNKGKIPDSKYMSNNLENKNKFRRACSVGREIRESKLDFKNIKDDLKSFKLKGESRWNKEETNKEESSKPNKYYDSRSRKELEKTNNNQSNVKYSPRKNNRDPRMRHENSYERKSDYRDDRSRSRDSKSYGIVYSNDNITKGTILGPGYGVKNYKIPKIKRPHETELKDEGTENNLKDSENFVVDKNKTSESKKSSDKNISDKKESNVTKDKALDFKTSSKENKEEMTNNLRKPKEIKYDVDSPERIKVTTTKSKVKDDQNINKSNSDPQELTNNSKKQEIVTEGSSIDVANNTVDNIEKRITRSASKNLSLDSLIDISPVKRPRRGKKPFVYESDSDDNEKKEKNAVSKNLELSQVTSNKITDFIQHDESDVIVHDGSKNVNTKTVLNDSCGKSNVKKISSSLDTGFEIDDLEIFSDNIVTDPVIDNINALIADLDQDLDSSKTVQQTKNNFTRELTLETMLENITSPEDNEETRNMNNELSENLKTELKETIESNTEADDSKREADCKLNTENETKGNHLQTTNEPKHVTTQSCENIKTIESESKHEKTSEIKNNHSDEAIVSTSGDEDKQSVVPQLQKENNLTIDSNPDSTININATINSLEFQRNLPDSTNELNSETNSIISSTHNVLDTTNNKNISEPKDVLKKIKELLGLLGGQSGENEKLKKKIEKLSKIVSDDEENILEEKETEKQNNYSSERQFIISDNPPTVLQQEQNKEVSNKVYNNLELLKQNVQMEKEVNCSMKENNDHVIFSGPNEVNIEVSTRNSNETNDDVSLEENENENSIESKVQENKTVNEDDSLLTAKEIQVTTKDNKNVMTKKGKRKTASKVKSTDERRLTRSDASDLRFDKPIVKKPSRELQKLQDDLKDMFIRDDVLRATGIRMCRLAKLVDDVKVQKEEQNNEISSQKPVVVLEKCNDLDISEGSTSDKLNRKKTVTVKGKNKLLELDTFIESNKIPLSKKLIVKLDNSSVTNIKNKLQEKNGDVDPYIFETDSANVTKNTSGKKENNSSESESESLSSSKSFGSTELLAEVKKKVKRKRIRKGWKEGVIKPKHKKKKVECKSDATLSNDNIVEERKKDNIEIPDLDCYTDKSYCFNKNVSVYDCRLCSYNGTDIVLHYKKQHPHSEIPLSRMSPTIAMEAIKESEKINFQAICKVSSKKYTCRFCFKEFGRQKPVLELFFWHVVSNHTGEYKQLCAECLNINRCPFKLDIPPPPIDSKGQLLGYVCEKCNFTQVSLENLKTHVILRHNDEQTAVYTINLSVTTKSIMKNRLIEDEDIYNTNAENQLPRVLRSSRSNQSVGESSDVKSDTTDESFQNRKKRRNSSIEKETVSIVEKSTKLQSKFIFENDNIDEISNFDDNEISKVKIESEMNENRGNSQSELVQPAEEFETPLSSEKTDNLNVSNDICNYPHFKIKYSESGSKEYICCINGNVLHYRTTLLISFKKHVQLKHSEKWDGYCFICKVIVTPQGQYLFKDCLQHFLDQHIDNFPVLEETPEQELSSNEPDASDKSICENIRTKPYINVRPLSELISQSSSSSHSADESALPLPVIESVVSLGTGIIEKSQSSSSYPNRDTTEVVKQYRHEEAQAEVMTRKHRVVLEAMLSQVKLVQVFKCAGRFCSFTTDSADDALLHASTHTRVGGEDSLKCVYCDFDSSGNAIDLITHVFKSHGCCQYACGMCFYRAAASQLVKAHIKRIHPTTSRVTIFYTALQTALIKEDNILSREAAVPYYLCCTSSGSDAPCKFRTYTPGKFCEHLQMRHSSATEHSCFMCSATLSTPADLIRHLKTHGLKLYQCTWCVFGADNETELLEHASANHPDKQPKAYLRIITNKEGTSEFRVLPLAHLNKSDVPAVEVMSSSFRENPVREAERSIDLEKLIGQTTRMIESIPYVSELKTTEKPLTYKDTGSIVCEPLVENVNLLEQPSAKSKDVSENKLQPSLKTETIEITPEKSLTDPNVVYCLDSDEEETSKNVTNDFNDQSSSNTPVNVQPPQILPPTQLFLCAKCKMTLKCGAGFKKHIIACFSQMSDPIPCAHCSVKVNKKNIVTHYTKTHAEVARNHACSKCPIKFSTLAQVREHERNDHPLNTNINLNADKASISTGKLAASCKRKRSLVNREKDVEPPDKVRRFGPHDVSLLPINPILDDYVFCSLCEFNTKVRLNMVRHLQLHAEQQIVPQTAPVNPVPHLETNEKHFDKMLNLASSSIVSRPPEKNKADSNTTVTLMIPPEAISRYPKYVPEKHRHTCGAKGCSYISVDESMFKCHWETLHSGASDYRCVHCPPHQQLDTSKPLTSVRIIGHLKMHDSTLYACSLCSYYHYKRHIVENHLSDIHKGGQVMVVREEGSVIPVNTVQAQTSAPTMDLKPWLCGLCNFKSLLRLEVVDHCAKEHNSKMQYKCAYCAFRTSNSENVTKHQNKSHPDKKEEIFYFYYREGSVPQNPDGIPLWQKQSQKCDLTKPKIKSELPSEVSLTPQVSLPLSKSATPELDLNLVKKEVIETVAETIEDLCKAFGEFCEPNGLKYKCSLCKNVVEDNYDAMQSHLYEELQYRKWGCSICSYKAFHRAGLSSHMQTEHRQNKEPIALEVDNRIETWVTKVLEYQTELIEKNKENLVKQKEELLRSVPGPSRPKSPSMSKVETTQMNQLSSNKSSTNKPTMVELERIFGPLGISVNMSFCCPKCHSMFKDEDAMKNHLENELNKIRWLCSNCSITFQTYHEAQFHCSSVHIRQTARPIEAIRDITIRSAWIEAVIRVQKLSMNYVPLPAKNDGKDLEETEAARNVPENSLLVVRYEERVATPEEQMARKTPIQIISNQDSDDDKLIIDEPGENRKVRESTNCPHCQYSSVNNATLHCHILRHYNLRPYTCAYCNLNGYKKLLIQHQKYAHANQPINCLTTPVPAELPADFFKKSSKLICLVCRNSVTETQVETGTHVHNKTVTSFGRKGEVVVKCNICFTLHKDVCAYLNHHKSFHDSMSVNYVFSKLTTNETKTMVYACSICEQEFNHLRDLKTHANSNHGSDLKYTIVPKFQEIARSNDEVINLDDEEDTERKRKCNDFSDFPSNKQKRMARKSTTKLPYNNSVARKSTTKLPFDVQSEPEEFSYYGTRPSNDDLDDVTTMMSFCNTMVPFTFKKLGEIINVNPVVKVEKLNES